MWEDKTVQAEVLKYVPLWAVTKTQGPLAAKYGVMRGAALVVADAPGSTLLVQRGIPFTNTEKALAWFGGIAGKLQAVNEAKAKCAATPEDTQARTALAEAYAVAGRLDDAIAAFGEVAARHAAGSDERISIEFKRAGLATQKSDFELAGKLYESVVPALIEKRDERAVTGATNWASILISARKADKAREVLLKVVQTFPKHERRSELRVRAATCRISMPKPDYADIAKELRGIAEGAADNDTWAKNALRTAEALEKRATSTAPRTAEPAPKEAEK